MVIPTYNERERLETLVDQVLDVCDSHGITAEIVIVDDNSPDGTGPLADRLAETRAVTVLHRSGKLGLGSAVVEGFAVARGAVVGVMDADLSHPASVVPVLYRTLLDAAVDFALGSRYVRGGGSEAWPLGRQVLSTIACWAARPLTPARDPMSGFFMMRRSVAAGVQTTAQGFKIGLEYLVRLRPRSIAEVPFVFIGRATGESKMGPLEGLRYARQLASLYLAAAQQGFARPRHLVIDSYSEPSGNVSEPSVSRASL